MNIQQLKELDAKQILNLKADDLEGISGEDFHKLKPDQLNAVIQARISHAVFAARRRGALTKALIWLRSKIPHQLRKAFTRDRQTISPGVSKKLEDFDFHELTAGIANSVTDKLYRTHIPALSARYAGELSDREKALEHLDNDFAVDPLVESIRKSVALRLEESVTKAITYRVLQDFEEQYHPNKGTLLRQFGGHMRSLRLLMVPAYLVAGFVLLSITALSVIKSFEIAAQTGCYVRYIGGKLIPGEDQTGEYCNTIIDAMVASAGSQSEPSEIETPYSAPNVATLTAANGATTPSDASAEHAGSGTTGSRTSVFNTLVGNFLKIADLLLVGTLFVMVMIGGYENSVGRIGMSHDTPTWFGKLGIAELKMRVAASIVIISSVHLLLTFMSLDLRTAMGAGQLWTVGAITAIHMVFVASALILAHVIQLTEPHQKTLADRFAGGDSKPEH